MASTISAFSCVNSLVCLANISLSISSISSWIIDTGATDHITPFSYLLTNPIPVHNLIHLPNGQTSIITYKGTIHLTFDLTLYNVLYVPSSQYNLISGHKLANDSRLSLSFFPTHCYFQDLVQKTVNEIGKLEGSLYKLVLPRISAGRGLFNYASFSFQLSTFYDSDRASCHTTKKSLSSYCVLLGSSLMSWKTKKQTTVSRSSSQTEYRFMASSCCKVTSLVAVLKDF